MNMVLNMLAIKTRSKKYFFFYYIVLSYLVYSSSRIAYIQSQIANANGAPKNPIEDLTNTN